MARRTHKRKFAKRRISRRLVKKQSGGGKLDKLPVGPGSRKADGTPGDKFSAADNLNGRRRAFATMNNMIDHRNRYSALATNEAFITHLKRFDGTLPSSVYRTIIRPNNNIGQLGKIIEKTPSGVNLGLAEEVASLNSDQLISNMRNDFRDNWEFFYVMGHGVLAPKLPNAKVPDRTYVRFNTPGGCRSVDSSSTALGILPMMAFPETFTLPPEEFLTAMTKHHIENTGPLESFTSLEERRAVEADPFPADKYCTTPRNLMSESTKARCLSSPQKKQTIYGPGENIHEMTINFSNNPLDMSAIGVYSLPIPFDFIKSLSDMTAALEEAARKKSTTLTKAEFNVEILKQKLRDSAIFGHGSPNLEPGLIGNKMSLAELFAALPEVPDGKVRFLFINSCRGVPFTIDDSGLRNNLFNLDEPANNGSAVGGAGTGPAAASAAASAKKLLTPAQRYAFAATVRRNSVTTGPRSEIDAKVEEEYEKWLVNYKIMKENPPGTEKHEAAKKEVERIEGIYVYNTTGKYFKLQQKIEVAKALF